MRGERLGHVGVSRGSDSKWVEGKMERRWQVSTEQYPRSSADWYRLFCGRVKIKCEEGFYIQSTSVQDLCGHKKENPI